MIGNKIKINRNTAFLYFILFLSAYNDILRFPGTSFSLFRFFQPVTLLFCLLVSKKCKKVFIIYAIIVIINFLQSNIFTLTNGIGFKFDFKNFLTFSYYYLCITTVICVTITIYEKNEVDFEENFMRFIRNIGRIHLIILFLHGFLRANSNVILGNINNYGAAVVCICPIYIIRAYQKRKIIDIITCVLCLIALYFGDCKLSIAGMVFEIILVVLLSLRNKQNESKANLKPLYFVLGFIIILIVYYVLLNNDMGVSIVYGLTSAINNIRERNYISESTSIAYRTNVVILGLEWLWKTKLLGIGMGNFGRLVRMKIPYYFEKWTNTNYISPHNAILEMLIEFGPISIVLYYRIIIRIIKTLKSERTDRNILFLVVFISIWLWILNPSEILTLYVIWFVLAYLLIINKNTVDDGNKIERSKGFLNKYKAYYFG